MKAHLAILVGIAVGHQARLSRNWLIATSLGVAVGVAGHMDPFFCLPWLGDCSPRNIRGFFTPTFRVGLARRF